MKKMKLVVEHLEEPSGLLPIWSVVYVQVENVSFPSQHWYDATTSILVMWINSVSRLIARAESEATLNFMDGDYSIKLESHDGKQATASFQEPDKKIATHITIDLLYFGRQLLAAVGKLKEHTSAYLECRAVQEVIAESEYLRTIIKSRRNIE